MKELQLKQNTPEWLEARKNYRTASEAAIVCGVSPFTSVNDFKLIKAGLKTQFYSKAMQLGHELEDTVRQWASDKLNRSFQEACWARDRFMASLDGIDGDTLVEIKVSDYTYNDLKEGNIPEYYWLQVQQQLHCSPATKGYLVAYSPKEEDYYMSEEILYTPAAISRIADAWEQFDAMPIPEQPIDMSDDVDVTNLFIEYENLKQQADKIKGKMEDIKKALLYKGETTGIVCGDFKLVKKKGATRVDYKKAVVDADLDTTDYTTEGKPSYSITLPKNPFL